MIKIYAFGRHIVKHTKFISKSFKARFGETRDMKEKDTVLNLLYLGNLVVLTNLYELQHSEISVMPTFHYKTNSNLFKKFPSKQFNTNDI